MITQLISRKIQPFILGMVSGLSVFYFLYFFDAYGIQTGLSYSGHSHLFRSMSFGILTFVYISILETWLRPKIIVESFKNLFLWYTVLVIIGSHLIFVLFNFFWNWQELNLEAYALIMKEFPLMMVLPMVFYLTLKRFTKPKSKEEDYVTFRSDNGKDRLKIRIQDFLFANSSGNYVSIAYQSGEKMQQHLIRKPLKVLENELKNYPLIVRNHRSYLVNKANVSMVKELKGKYFLEIGNEILPISKKFQGYFLS